MLMMEPRMNVETWFLIIYELIENTWYGMYKTIAAVYLSGFEKNEIHPLHIGY